MKFIKILGTVATVVAFTLPFAASAATIDNVQFDNNQTTTSCTAGSSVNVTFRVTIPANEVIELAQVDVIGDTLAPALPVSVGGDLGLQEGQNDIQMSVTCPQNTANYGVQLKTAGIYGGQRAVNITDGVTQSVTFNSALRVTASSTGGSTVGGSTALDQLTAAVAALAAQVNAILHPVTPTPTPVSGVCAQLITTLVGTQMNVSNSANVALQGFLLFQHQSIPALAAGASFGFFGPQTQNALSAFKLQNSCQ